MDKPGRRVSVTDAAGLDGPMGMRTRSNSTIEKFDLRVEVEFTHPHSRSHLLALPVMVVLQAASVCCAEVRSKTVGDVINWLGTLSP